MARKTVVDNSSDMPVLEETLEDGILEDDGQVPTENGTPPVDLSSRLPLGEGVEPSAPPSLSPPEKAVTAETVDETAANGVIAPRGFENARGRWIGDDAPPWVGEETDRWWITNWSGYRNFHCKWEKCQFVTVGGLDTIEEHYRGHVLREHMKRREEGSHSSLSRSGFIGQDGRPL